MEFEANSLWYETSLTLVAQALKQGERADYHAFQHLSADVREGLARLSVDVKRMEEAEILRIIDSYTVTTGIEFPEEPETSRRFFESRSLSFKDWSKELTKDIGEGSVDEARKKRLHVDDNNSILMQYNDEKSFIDFWRTKIIPEVRKLEFACINAVVTQTYSNAFYRQLESLSDGIIDMRTQEEHGRIEQYLRLRWLRGKASDSRWRHLRLLDNGEVSMETEQQMASHEGSMQGLTPLMTFLLKTFIDDYMHRRLDLTVSGWRSLPQISRSMKIPRSQVYGDSRYGHDFGTALEPLVRGGLVEYRLFSGKGRGGKVLKVRLNYEKEPIRRLIDTAALKPSREQTQPSQ